MPLASPLTSRTVSAAALGGRTAVAGALTSRDVTADSLAGRTVTASALASQTATALLPVPMIRFQMDFLAQIYDGATPTCQRAGAGYEGMGRIAIRAAA